MSVAPSVIRFTGAASDVAAGAPRRLARLGRGWLVALRDEGWPLLLFRAQRLGLAGLVGIGLLAGTAVFQFSTRAPLVAEVERLGQELAAHPAVARAQLNPADPLGIIAQLPERKELPEVLGRVVAEAGAAGLELTSGKYETAVSSSGSVVRYRVTFPVNGRYRQVRMFVDAILEKLPYASLSGLSLERRAVGDVAVDANVSLTLFLREAP